MDTLRTMRIAWLYIVLLWTFQACAQANNNCSCGYVDGETEKLFTDSIIVYFNETAVLPLDNFLAESYVNKYELGWNSVFRQAADPANVIPRNGSSDPSNDTSLELVVSPATTDHLVVGGGIRTIRQDILYGTFRARVKSPGKDEGGSSLSMMLQFNQSSRITLNLQNGDIPRHAWMSTLVNAEFPDLELGVNYTNLSRHDREYGAAQPWDYNELKIDWTPDSINYFINDHPTRMVNGTDNNGAERPYTASPFTLKHWSVGDVYSMYGPPQQAPSKAGIQWVRLFFNTSSVTKDARKDFDSKCAGQPTCSVDDTTLRGSTPYPPEASQAFVPQDTGYRLRWWAIAIGSFGLLVSVTVLLNVLLRNCLLPAHKPSHEGTAATAAPVQPQPEQRPQSEADASTLAFNGGTATPLVFHRSPPISRCASLVSPASPRDPWNVAASTGTLVSPTPMDLTRPPTPTHGSSDAIRTVTGISERLDESRHQSMNDMVVLEQMPLPAFGSRAPSPRSQSPLGMRSSSPFGMRSPSPFRMSTRTMSILSSMSGGTARAGSFLGRAVEGISYGPALPIEDLGPGEVARGGIPQSRTTTMVGSRTSTMMSTAPMRPNSKPLPPVPVAHANNSRSSAPVAPRTRVDYLAGLVGVCSVLVSLTHFMLTFVPATIESGAFAHYDSEVWASRTIGPFFFNEVWVVIFFTTSTRFLVTKYLRSGDLGTIAEKVVGRVFRLMIPIMGVILLEYFLMDVGAINWLQYLPSVSWSTWVYTTVFPNFGSFINETLQLIYIIPNAMPSITFNYCTGVLWTIPVQIQGSWQAMLGVIVVSQIKTPWKRFGYYAFCILNHWYARSWGSFFMAGLLLADLDITFKYRKWLYARPMVYYPLLNMAIFLTLLALGNDLTSSWTGFDFTTTEAGWHPSHLTGRFRIQDGDVPFPPYYFPKMNGLIFAVGSQLVVEWSRWVQKAVSTKVFLWLFPHIFTIYLFHGFIFWSVGAWICVGLAGWGVVPYWANMIVTAVGSYLALFACLPLITPVVEALGKTLTANIWQSASECPPKKRPTLFPFPGDLFTCRGGGGGNVAGSDDGSSLTAASTSSQQEKTQEKVDKIYKIDEIEKVESREESSEDAKKRSDPAVDEILPSS